MGRKKPDVYMFLENYFLDEQCLVILIQVVKKNLREICGAKNEFHHIYVSVYTHKKIYIQIQKRECRHKLIWPMGEQMPTWSFLACFFELQKYILFFFYFFLPKVIMIIICL